MTRERYTFHSLLSVMLLALIMPALVYALPPSEVTSADNVMIKLEHGGSNYYRFTTGEYNYRFLWDGGPTQLKIHGILGYDTEGNVVDYAPAQASTEGVPSPDAQFSFKGVGKARHASTDLFQIPAAFYLNRQIDHIAVDFSVVDGRMSVGPWLPMKSPWGDPSAVREHLELLLW